MLPTRTGETDPKGWQQKTLDITGTGTHTLRWQYKKDSRASRGQDRAWVDALVFTPD